MGIMLTKLFPLQQAFRRNEERMRQGSCTLRRRVRQLLRRDYGARPEWR